MHEMLFCECNCMLLNFFYFSVVSLADPKMSAYCPTTLSAAIVRKKLVAVTRKTVK